MEYILDMKDIEFDGDVLDIGKENHGVIYNLTKNSDDEICIDYVDILNTEKSNDFKTGVFFFTLSKIWRNSERRELIKEVWEHIGDEGLLYIWDIEKRSKEIINIDIKVLMPKDKTKTFSYKDFNPINECTTELLKKILENYFEIEETKFWDKIYFIKAKKRGRTLDESVINSGKF
ncbi:hypothetical protein CPJCM30710_22120 [Clostridium polyendosporum]|uniref:Uncharacterized protein n=1 Tax=Clostridium polyendosporum TaxID=69208 RepID=A0A919S1F8_9CLOT|nr:hypothetical protein [Clostridium polyendosporum]GIM29546.1 hypothetical protein CPJCM30710_22120 [Clostridium polyendosporum]